MPKSDTVAKNTKILLVKNILKFERVFLELTLPLLLEDFDKIRLQNMLNGHSKTPTEAYYLELGILPIKYIIKSRRIMFLHYILSRDENDLLAKFFEAQNLRPGKNDWCYTVKMTWLILI